MNSEPIFQPISNVRKLSRSGHSYVVSVPALLTKHSINTETEGIQWGYGPCGDIMVRILPLPETKKANDPQQEQKPENIPEEIPKESQPDQLSDDTVLSLPKDSDDGKDRIQTD